MRRDSVREFDCQNGPCGRSADRPCHRVALIIGRFRDRYAGISGQDGPDHPPIKPEFCRNAGYRADPAFIPAMRLLEQVRFGLSVGDGLHETVGPKQE